MHQWGFKRVAGWGGEQGGDISFSLKNISRLRIVCKFYFSGHMQHVNLLPIGVHATCKFVYYNYVAYTFNLVISNVDV